MEIYHVDESGWHVATAKGADPARAVEAAWDGAGRKLLAQGDGGFYTQAVRIPAGFEAPEHSHDHSEVFMVLEGSCTFAGRQMGRFDSTVVEANEPYGFRAGPDGLTFLVVRQAPATYSESGP